MGMLLVSLVLAAIYIGWLMVSFDQKNVQDLSGKIVARGIFDYAEHRAGGIFSPSYTIIHFANGETFTSDYRLNIPYPKDTKIEIARKKGLVTNFWIVSAIK